MRQEFAWKGTGMPQVRRRTLMDAEGADWVRLSPTRAIGPTTFFHLLDRYGAAADVLAGLPTLAKKAGEAPSAKRSRRRPSTSTKSCALWMRHTVWCWRRAQSWSWPARL